MLEHFSVNSQDQVLVSKSKLFEVTLKILLAMRMPEADASLASDALIEADMRGCETHGVSNMLRNYVKAFRTGQINPNPKWKYIVNGKATATIDADKSHGLVICPKAMDIAIEKAKKYGIGAVTILNSTHAGMMAYHSMRALKHDMIGYAITGGGAVMVPTFGAIPRVGAVPHSWAVPTDKEPPFVLDISSSSVAANKIELLRRTGAEVLPGFLANEQGTPEMKPHSVPNTVNLLPWGSTRELGSHKGYGLAVVGQVFSGILSSGLFGVHPEKLGSQFVAAYSIDAFTEVQKFKRSMDEFLTYLKETPPAPGHDRVYYAGEIEHEEMENRTLNGIPLHFEVIEWFKMITKELKIPSIDLD